jgi:hypothetical protein
VIKSSSEALEAAPSFVNAMDLDDMADADMDTMDNGRAMLAAPMVERDGYVATENTDLTAEMLTGARVYGIDDEDVGEINSLILDDNGAIDRAVIDVGGFLGMGEKQIAVTFDELTILRQDGGDDVQVYIDATQEALEAQPAYAN